MELRSPAYRAFFGQLFDAPAEVVIAQGRVVLSVISLAGVAIDPTEPPELAPFVATILGWYALYAITFLAALHWRRVHNVSAKATHAIDIAIVAVLLFLTEGFSSPFLVFFTFVLLAASLRWDWQGILATICALTILAGIIALIDFKIAPSFDLNQTIIRSAYLVVAGTFLAYASAHREHERGRITKLAQWVPPSPAKDRAALLEQVLGQAVSVLDAHRAVIIWQEADNKRRFAHWHDNHCDSFDDFPDAAGAMVASELAGLTFSRTLPDLTALNVLDGASRNFTGALDGAFITKFEIGEFSSAPFRGIGARGRLFILEKIRRSDDHLLVTRILADRVGAELDRQIFLEQASESAATRERAGIMRDLHDGLLQNLTAARAQLELLSMEDEAANSRLQTIRDLLRIEQRRIRQFLDQARAADTERVPIGSLRSFTDELARFWGCDVMLVMPSEEALVARKTLNQLSLLVAEAVANAVRHGGASHVQVAVSCQDDRMDVEVKDDGRGFPDRIKAEQGSPIPEEALPRSLKERLSELGGRLQVRTSGSGTQIEFGFPL